MSNETTAVRVLKNWDAIKVLEGTVGAPSRAELVELLRELAEGAKAEVPVGYCPQCGFRPSLRSVTTNLCGVCVFGR